MRKVKINLSIIAVFLGIGLAYAGNSLQSSPDPNKPLYGYDAEESSWVLIQPNEQHNCSGILNICVAQFEGEPGSSSMTYSEPGEFSR